MTANSNIITFPKSKNIPTPTIEEIQENADSIRQMHVDEILELVNEFLMDQIMTGGFHFDFEKTNYNKNLAMISESIRALLYRYYNMEHPLHGVSENLFKFNPDKTVDWAGEEFLIMIREPAKEQED